MGLGGVKRLQRGRRMGEALMVCLVLFFLPTMLISEDRISIPCEVMEVQKAEVSSLQAFRDTHYTLIHHLNPQDRPALSRCLQRETGHEVTFSYQGKGYTGVLFRLDHCFGRGLLIYQGEPKLTRGDTITLDCPAH